MFTLGYLNELRDIVGSRPLISVGATILVTNRHNELLFQHRSDTNTWGLPGGSMELGETLEDVAARELQEETSLNADSFAFLAVASGPRYRFVYPNGDDTHSVIHLYHARDVSGDVAPQDDESLALAYFGRDALPTPLESRAAALLEQFDTLIWQLEPSRP